MKRREILAGAAVVAVVLIMIVALVRREVRTAGQSRAVPQTHPLASGSAAALTEPHWANGHRITVEVLNATKVRGLARRAARTLRDRGFDVVSTGTNPDQFDSTKVLDRTGHRDWAMLAAQAMGGGAVLVRPDSSREVDLTVLIGASWRAPSQPFYP